MPIMPPELARCIGRIVLLRRLSAIVVLSALFMIFGLHHRGPTASSLEEPPAASALAAEQPPLPVVFETAELARGKRAFERGEYSAAHDDFLIAAQNGDPLAQEVIGFMYAFGTAVYPGVGQNLAAAGSWLELAARNGRPNARHFYCALVRQALTDRRLSELNCFEDVWVEDRY